MNRLKRCLGMLPLCALLWPAAASARSKPLDPVTVHDRIVKRGVGSWICVEEANGIALVGRVVSIGDQSVGLQLENYPEVTPVPYLDIVGLRTGISKKAMFTIIGVSLGAAAAMAAVGFHELNENRVGTPTLPTLNHNP
ncbi:MAG TPA: hypothetical protein VHX20_17840 [Terracidiphilus sp.]|nr:hypothetical protein [Terracidiphilus sp.]